MTVSTELELQSFVLLRLGERRFAVSASADLPFPRLKLQNLSRRVGFFAFLTGHLSWKA